MNLFCLFLISIIILRSIRLFSSVQFGCSVMSNSLRPHGLQHTRPAITNSRSLLKLMSIKSVMPSNNLILCHPLLFLPWIFLSISVFSKESVLHIRQPKYWSFSFSIRPSNEHSGLISFGINWFHFAVQGTLKSLLNTTLQKHQFFDAQLSLWSKFHIHRWLLEKPRLWLDGPLSAK